MITGNLAQLDRLLPQVAGNVKKALELLKEVDVIAAEDTRNSVKLLNHFDIHTPMTSYHEYNKVE